MKILYASLTWAVLIGSILTLSLSQTGCVNGQLSTAAGTDISNALLTAANVLQEQNTGLQTASPTIDQLLTLTHNQGDAAAVNNVVAIDAAASPALSALLSAVSVAVKSNTAPAAQIAAVNQALSPATVAAIVAPIQAGAAVSTTN